MTHLDHGHGTEHAYVTGRPAVEHGHGAEHGYVTAAKSSDAEHTSDGQVLRKRIGEPMGAASIHHHTVRAFNKLAEHYGVEPPEYQGWGVQRSNSLSTYYPHKGTNGVVAMNCDRIHSGNIDPVIAHEFTHHLDHRLWGNTSMDAHEAHSPEFIKRFQDVHEVHKGLIKQEGEATHKRAAKDPDALKFKLWQSPKTKKDPDQLGTHSLTAVHPSKGPVGTLQYVKRADHLQVEMLSVPREHRGNGYAGHLMDEMQRRHPGTPINHGERTDAGQDWWDSYSAGKTVTDGRTMATRRTAADHPFIHVSPREFKPGDRIESADDHGGASTFDYSDLDRVYLSHPDHAEYWGNTVGTAGGHHEVHHYEVEPHDHPEFQFSSDGEEEYTSSGATVKRKVRTQKVDPRAYTRERIHPSLLAGGEGWAKEHDRGESQYAQRVPSWEKKAVSVSWDHNHDDPSTWSEDYHAWVKEKPHAVAVSQAQEHVRRHVPTMGMDLGSGEDATNAMQHMLRKGGHPDHDEGFVMKHPNLGWGQSQAFTSDGQPGVALHPSKWDYGTLAHETAHHLHQHELGRKPRDDAEAHGPDFIRHYQSLLGDFGRGASDKLGEKYHESLGRLQPKQATKEPSQRLFGRTFGLDHRLFEGEHLKDDVRRYILETLGEFWKGLHGYSWDEWARVYFAGSEASEWTSESLEGNGDFDVLIGVDYDKFRGHACRCHPAGSDEEITARLNEELRRLDEKTSHAMILIDGKREGPFDNTWYVNKDSWDIRRIKPYAAYDVTNDRWAVKPPHLPDWDLSQFPEGHALVQEAHAVAAYVRSVLALPEPFRSQQATALWTHLHSDRSRAFGPQGEGWYDSGNVLEKYLDQLGLWQKLVDVRMQARDHPEMLDAPQGWSNDPHRHR